MTEKKQEQKTATKRYRSMIRNVLEYLENSARQYGDKIAFADENSSLTFSLLYTSDAADE